MWKETFPMFDGLTHGPAAPAGVKEFKYSQVYNWLQTEVGWVLICVELYFLFRFSQMLQKEWRFTVQLNNDPKHIATATHKLFKAKKWNICKPNWACFSFTEEKTEGRKTHKQAAT